MTIVAPSPTSVYRYYDRTGLLLYVGITSRGIRRQAEHNSDKEWWPFVVRQEVEHHPTRQQAAAREKSLIREFRPPFNRQHNLDHENLRAYYLAAAPHLPERRPVNSSAIDPREAFAANRGKVPITQTGVGNVATFAVSSAFQSLLLAAAPFGRERVLLLTPRKSGVLTNIDLAGTDPTLTFTGERGGIPKLRNVRLHLKVVVDKPFVVRIHEAVGEKMGSAA